MGNPLKVYTLGHSGVIIDAAPTEPTLPLDALINAQNATHDPKEAHRGALRKRAGLRKFNTTYAGGAILGGIPMLVAGTGGAPAQSQFPGIDDATGSPVGAGAGTGAPGSSTGGSGSSGGGSGVPSAGAGLFPQGATAYPNQRLMIVGRANNFNPGDGNGLPDSNGWYIVRSDWNTALAAKHQDATPGPPDGYGPTGTPYPPTALFRTAFGRPSVFDPTTGYLFYAQSHLRTASPPGGTLQASIRKTNGAVDVFVCTLPDPQAIIYSIILSDDGAALFVAARIPNVANTGSIYRVEKASGQITKIQLQTNPVINNFGPFCMATFAGKLFIGEWGQLGNEVNSSTSSAVYATPAQDGSQPMTIDAFLGANGAGTAVTCMLAFPANDPVNQILFVGIAVNGSQYAAVFQRQRKGIADPAAYSSPNGFVPSDTTPVAGNIFTSFVQFQGNLYAAWRNGGTGHNAYIFKFVPNLTHLASDGGWDGTGTWSTVYGPIGQGTGQFAWNLYVDGGYMYAISGGESNISDNQAVITTDGTTWTDKSSVIFDHGVNDDCPLGCVFFLNQ